MLKSLLLRSNCSFLQDQQKPAFHKVQRYQIVFFECVGDDTSPLTTDWKPLSLKGGQQWTQTHKMLKQLKSLSNEKVAPGYILGYILKFSAKFCCSVSLCSATEMALNVKESFFLVANILFEQIFKFIHQKIRFTEIEIIHSITQCIRARCHPRWVNHTSYSVDITPSFSL